MANLKSNFNNYNKNICISILIIGICGIRGIRGIRGKLCGNFIKIYLKKIYELKL